MFSSPALDPRDPVRAELEQDGRFRVIARIGAGGMGVVYRVHDRERAEDVALKTLKLPSPAAIYGIKREFRSLADVAHPNLVALRELLCIHDRWCITMELVEGTDFLSYVTHRAAGAGDLLTRTTQLVPALLDARTAPRALAADGMHTRQRGPDRDEAGSMPADLDRLASALAQLSSAVAALHAQKKLHLDLKPMNVLVQPDGRVVVLDFGLVREIEGQEPLLGASVLGTPIYMAPEQAFFGSRADPRAATSLAPSEAADWYAIGCMLYEALTGITPFIGPVQSLLVEKQLRDAPSAREVVGAVPAAWSDLCQKLLRRDPRARGGLNEVNAVLSAAGRRAQPARPLHAQRDARPSFVGRADLRARMTGLFAETRHGAPRALFLHGASGIGKTALARAWLDSQRATSEQLLLLEGRCLEREAVPYKALDSVIDELSRFLQTLSPAHLARIRPTHVAALVRVFPVLSRVPAFAGYDARRARSSEDQTERELAFLALKGLLARIAQEQRVLIFIDDLQWGDRDSALFVRELLSLPDAPGVFWLGTYRSEEEASSPFLQTLFAPSSDDALNAALVREPVPALEPEEMKKLSQRMLAQQGRASELADAIVAECQGNPFFAEELVRALEPDHASKVAPAGPPRLEDVLLRRVSALPAPEQRLLELVCVVGRPIERSLVLELGEAGQAALDALRAHRLLRAHGARELDLIEPYHDRIREIVGGRVAASARSRIHLAVAQRLEAKQRGDAELLLLHYAEAGDHARAAAYAVRAASVAQEALAFDHAIALLRRALALGAGHAEARAEIELHVALGLSLSCAGYSAEAAQAYLVAASKSAGPEALTLRRKAAEQHLVGGRYQQGIALLHETLPALGVKLRKSSQSALSSIAYQRARLGLRGLGFRERAEAAVDASLLARIDTSYAVASGLGMLDSLVAADVQTRGVLWSLAAGEPFRVLRALTYEAAFRCGNLGGQAETEKIIARAEALSVRLDTQVARGLVAFCKAFYAHHGRGDLREVKQPYAAGEELLLGSPGMNGEVVMLRCNFFTALDWLGDLTSLRARIPMHLADAERRGDLLLKTGIVSAALYWLGQDASSDLGAHIEACRRDWPRDLFVMPHYWLLVAELQRDIYLGDGRGALARSEGAWRALKRSFYLSIPTVRIEILYPRARAALLCARQGQAARDMLALARRDLSTLANTRRAYALALVASLQPNLHLLAGDAQAYVIWSLERALQLCDEAGLVMQREAARYCLGQTLGGEAGGFEQRRALARLTAQGVKNPLALIAALMPAFSVCAA